MIAHVDEFVLYDDAQYTKHDWRNRNQIKTPQGRQWLTVPVHVKGRLDQKIREAEIQGTDWACRHWKTLLGNYGRAPFFKDIAGWLEPLYRDVTFTHVSTLNRRFIEAICAYLGIETTISNSWDYRLASGRSERLLDLCLQSGATEYVSGPSAKSYLDEGLFREKGIRVTWFDYDGYPEYPQLWGEFSHGVTILDLLFNCGRSSPDYMRFVE